MIADAVICVEVHCLIDCSVARVAQRLASSAIYYSVAGV
jgi:hypothetical protein